MEGGCEWDGGGGGDEVVVGFVGCVRLLSLIVFGRWVGGEQDKIARLNEYL